MARTAWCALVLGTVSLAGCSEGTENPFATTADTTGAESTSESSDPSSETGTSGDETGGLKLDVGSAETGGQRQCAVGGQGDAPGPCLDKAPAGSFEPELQWSWVGPEGHEMSVVTPLVANLNDDNDDGVVDLCDTPDVVVVTYSALVPGLPAAFVLDGDTGAVRAELEGPCSHTQTPAIGDIDGDGVPEIVGFYGGLKAWSPDGTLEWEGDSVGANLAMGDLALADLDNDGDVEIYGGGAVFDHEGNRLWNLESVGLVSTTPVAADLDGDGDLEITWGAYAFHHDGTPYYANPMLSQSYVFPQVADLDDDPEPEILVTSLEGVALLEHDGTTKWSGQNPNGDPIFGDYWRRPAAVHDFDGDGVSEFAMNSATHFSVFEADASVVWSADVQEESGYAAGTGFDFLGAGTAQAIFADEFTVYAFDDSGQVLLAVPRTSWTMTEYPVVVDIDNDASAEIVVVSNIQPGYHQVPLSPTVQVFRDVQDRWVPARRIWNQHTYHVTNVREDGTIPQFEQPHWTGLNTFRTQAQIDVGGSVCEPEG